MLEGITPVSADPDPWVTDRVRDDQYIEHRSAQDIDGDGITDIAVGIRKATAGGTAAAGAVDVRYGVVNDRAVVTGGQTRDPVRTTAASLAGQSVEAEEHVGASVATGQVNSFCADAAIGAPGADGGRGKVHETFGWRRLAHGQGRHDRGALAGRAIRLLGGCARDGELLTPSTAPVPRVANGMASAGLPPSPGISPD